MKCFHHLSLILIACSIIGCSSSLISTDIVLDPATQFGNDLEHAEQVLIAFFDALSQEDYRAAAQYHKVPNPLVFLYPDVDPENAEALLVKACNDKERFGCRFYCWKIKDIVDRTQASPGEFFFTVRFEDDDGNLLIDGDNVTPRVCDPPGCTHSEYAYTVIKSEGRFLVNGIPVFTGCWP